MTLVNRFIALIFLTDHNCFGGRVLFFWRDGLGGGGGLDNSLGHSIFLLAFRFCMIVLVAIIF